MLLNIFLVYYLHLTELLLTKPTQSRHVVIHDLLFTVALQTSSRVALICSLLRYVKRLALVNRNM